MSGSNPQASHTRGAKAGLAVATPGASLKTPSLELVLETGPTSKSWPGDREEHRGLVGTICSRFAGKNTDLRSQVNIAKLALFYFPPCPCPVSPGDQSPAVRNSLSFFKSST